jgi:hypothetical protein
VGWSGGCRSGHPQEVRAVIAHGRGWPALDHASIVHLGPLQPSGIRPSQWILKEGQHRQAGQVGLGIGGTTEGRPRLSEWGCLGPGWGVHRDGTPGRIYVVRLDKPPTAKGKLQLAAARLAGFPFAVLPRRCKPSEIGSGGIVVLPDSPGLSGLQTKRSDKSQRDIGRRSLVEAAMTPISVKILEYRRRAKRCRFLADNCLSANERESILKIASAWEEMAKRKEQQLGSAD